MLAKIISTILFWATRNRPLRELRPDYIDRYHLFNLGNYQIVLHHFKGGDVDKTPHNHPWPNAYSFILCGGYREVAYKWSAGHGIKRQLERDIHWFNKIKRETIHRIIACRPGTWTLFIYDTRNKNDWYFYHENGGVELAPFTRADWAKYAPSRKELEGYTKVKIFKKLFNQVGYVNPKIKLKNH